MDEDLQCPHCGDTAIVVSENPASLPWNDGDTDDIKCECCNKHLTVMCEVKRIEWKFVDEDYEEITYEDEY